MSAQVETDARKCCSLQESGRSFRRCMRATSCATTCRLCASLVSRSTTLCRAGRLRCIAAQAAPATRRRFTPVPGFNATHASS